MRRREFIAGLGSAATWPVAARAQQAAVPVIGYLGTTSPKAQARRLGLFRRGLSETGYIEGKNVATEYRWGGGQRDRYRPLAEDLVGRKVDLIVASGGALGAIAARPRPRQFQSSLPSAVTPSEWASSQACAGREETSQG